GSGFSRLMTDLACWLIRAGLADCPGHNSQFHFRLLFPAWLIVVIPYGGWITGIWLQSGENAISNGKSAVVYRRCARSEPRSWAELKRLEGGRLVSLICLGVDDR